MFFLSNHGEYLKTALIELRNDEPVPHARPTIAADVRRAQAAD